jgi:hypothetical protein
MSGHMQEVYVVSLGHSAILFGHVWHGDNDKPHPGKLRSLCHNNLSLKSDMLKTYSTTTERN